MVVVVVWDGDGGGSGVGWWDGDGGGSGGRMMLVGL